MGFTSLLFHTALLFAKLGNVQGCGTNIPGFGAHGSRSETGASAYPESTEDFALVSATERRRVPENGSTVVSGLMPFENTFSDQLRVRVRCPNIKQIQKLMIYRRIKKALREQNWFAVVLETLIVVLGVVIGFQVTAWSQLQEDLDTERSYLTQISADLARTQRLMVLVDESLAVSEAAAARLFDSFRKIDPLPSDSILVLASNSWQLHELGPVLGTMQALINTGELKLIRNDSLRLSIPANLEAQRSLDSAQKMINGQLTTALMELSGIVDMAEANSVEIGAGGTIDVPSPRVNTQDPDFATTAPFPFSAAEFRKSLKAYDVVYRIHHWKIQAKMIREAIMNSSNDLERMILRELSS